MEKDSDSCPIKRVTLFQNDEQSIYFDFHMRYSIFLSKVLVPNYDIRYYTLIFQNTDEALVIFCLSNPSLSL